MDTETLLHILNKVESLSNSTKEVIIWYLISSTLQSVLFTVMGWSTVFYTVYRVTKVMFEGLAGPTGQLKQAAGLIRDGKWEKEDLIKACKILRDNFNKKEEKQK